MFRTAALVLSFGLAAAAAAGEGDHSRHKSERDGVAVIHAWAPATRKPEATVFMEIRNDSARTVTLTGIRAGFGADAVLVASPINASGAPEIVPAFPIAPGTELDLAPGGLYIRVSGLAAPLEQGGEAGITLTFDPIGEIEAHVQIEAADARRHSHAGHSH